MIHCKYLGIIYGLEFINRNKETMRIFKLIRISINDKNVVNILILFKKGITRIFNELIKF